MTTTKTNLGRLPVQPAHQTRIADLMPTSLRSSIAFAKRVIMLTNWRSCLKAARGQLECQLISSSARGIAWLAPALTARKPYARAATGYAMALLRDHGTLLDNPVYKLVSFGIHRIYCTHYIAHPPYTHCTHCIYRIHQTHAYKLVQLTLIAHTTHCIHRTHYIQHTHYIQCRFKMAVIMQSNSSDRSVIIQTRV